MNKKISNVVILLLVAVIVLSRIQMTGSYTPATNRGVASTIDSNMIGRGFNYVVIDTATKVMKLLPAAIFTVDTVDGIGTTLVKIPHHMSRKPYFVSVEASSQDARNIPYHDWDSVNVNLYYDLTPNIGVKNLVYSMIIIRSSQ